MESTPLAGLSEEQIVHRWRRTILMEHGVPYLDAWTLAESDVELHLMVDYLERGVPPAMLMRIV